ncbi:MAG: hypothetical protein AMJ78_05870 [Omnitrophica WOR_2 bacterium SM23_29]|nr:MAG: hypothetical protein AMJ78_05870 [Omnitrophica WOR_2 bacterium SM23_29]
MKNLISKFFVVMCLATVPFWFFTTAYAAGEKIAYMDFIKIFDDYNKTKDFDKQLESKRAAIQKDRGKLVAEIKKLKDEMDLMSDKGKEAKQATIDQKLKKLQDFDREGRDALLKERDDMARQIGKEIKGLIEEIGKKEGYILILDSRAILFGKEGDDLTEEILKTLNERYAKRKK